MRKVVVALSLLPLVGCATNTQQVKTAEECRWVPNEDPGSNIKMKKECAPVEQGGSSTPTTQPAPH
jgi:hypothetical protein